MKLTCVKKVFTGYVTESGRDKFLNPSYGFEGLWWSEMLTLWKDTSGGSDIPFRITMEVLNRKRRPVKARPTKTKKGLR